MNRSFESAMEGQRSSQVLFLVLLLLIFFFDAFAQQNNPLSSAVERLVLLDLRSSLGLRSKDWPIKSDPCSHWKGVQCQNRRVTSITLSGLKRTRAGRLSPRFAVDALTNLTQLVSFNASGFSLPGSIPDWLGSRLVALQVLDLRSCRVSGSIPDSLGNLTSLRSLYLSDNNLAGSVPVGLGMLMELESLDLSGNSLTGLIPPSFASLRNVTRLELASNYLSGPVPESLGSLHNLQFLNLSDNDLAGTIPSQLGNLSRLVELDLSKNSLSGSLPEELKGLRHLRKMVMAENRLEGTLEGGLFSGLAGLQVVDLNGNRLYGALPGSLLSMPELHLLDVSSNNITGSLPVLNSSGKLASAANFNFSNNLMYGSLNFSLGSFGFIDLSNNYFQGKVLNDGLRNAALERNCLQNISDQRSLQHCSFFYKQRGLTFDSFGVPETVQPPFSESDSENKRRWVFILAGVLGGLGLVVVLVLVLILLLRKCNKGITSQRGTANVGPIPDGENAQPPKDSSEISGSKGLFTYEQLLQATGNFSETNLIKHGHSGDLFRGALEGGAQVVIKKVSLHTSTKESYMAELDLFRKVSHSRLVPLLGYCMEHESDRFLVYKYMPNADLASSFYRVSNAEDESLQSLDWITRLKIAIGAAEGLSYLHHECNPPLVHRDVQAGSILLDDKFEVSLGSFSETQVQEGDPHQSVFTRFLRKQQTSDPGPSSGSASTPASCSYDVYCFGMVLLKLVTGKLGVGKSEDAAVKEWLDQTLPYININDRESVSKIVDPSLIVDEDLLEEVWAMAIIARSCLNPKPSKRPPMKYVLKALENPWKIVREESFSSARLRTTSSRRSWSTAFFSSWRLSSSERSTVPGQVSGLKQSGRVGSHGSSGIEHSSWNKRLSSEVFPEPVEMQEIERPDGH